jgi:thiosulfate dehydrogenase
VHHEQVGGRLDSIRCTGPDDWFRREIEETLARDRVLVPVHTPELDFDEIDLYLPEETAERLRRFQMLEISSWYFKYAITEPAAVTACGGDDDAEETTTPSADETTTAAAAAPSEGSAVTGGLLFDKWWTVIGGDEPTDENPVWSRQTKNESSGGDTWRCKECHGWDYQGVDGAYGSGSHLTGFPGIFGAQGRPAEDIVALISGQIDPEHDFSSFLTESDMAALAAFTNNSLIDMPLFDLETKEPVSGDGVAGEALFSPTCTACHGEDGTTFNFGSEDEPEYVGTLSNDNPWEVSHKILFRHPGGSPEMPAQIQNRWGPQEIVDIVTFLQTLP